MGRDPDTQFRLLTERLAQRTSRRSFLFRATAILGLFGLPGYLLPIRRTTAAPTVQPCNTGNCCKARGIHSTNKCQRLSTEANSDKYWLYADLQGKPCAWGCCGAKASFGGCPSSVVGWNDEVLPVELGGCWLTSIYDCDGNVRCVAYVDCCIELNALSWALHQSVAKCEAQCTRINGRGTSWCGAGRVEPGGGGCSAPSGDKGYAFCTYARELHGGRCANSTYGTPQDNLSCPG